MPGYYLGIDGGTTNIKATILDENFIHVDEESTPVTLFTPFAGASEIDMDDYWARTAGAVKNLCLRNPDVSRKIAGVCVAGQGDGIWPLDKTGRPVCRAMLWNDIRSKNLNLTDNAAFNELAHKYRTNRVFAGSVTALLRWMKENTPEEFSKIRTVLHCKDWLNYRLTGLVKTDYTDSSTALLSVPEGRYVFEQLDAFGLGECREFFPEPVESASILGGITAQAAGETGLPAGIPVAVGAVDVCAAAFGAGMNAEGDACTIIGTTLANEIVISQQTAREADMDGLLLRHVLPGSFINILPTLSGTSSLDYMKTLLYPDESWQNLDGAIDKEPIGCGGLTFHPYLQGERAPFQNPFATAGLYGLGATHTKMQIMRSVYEGLTCSFLDCFSAFPIREKVAYLIGGAAKSPVVCQMFADMLGKECTRPRVKELGTLGTVRILFLAMGKAKKIEDFPGQQADVFSPSPVRTAQYTAVHKRFVNLRKHVSPTWI